MSAFVGIDHARIAYAAAYAVTAHAGQMRKKTEIPYASYVLAVGALVLEHGGTTEQVVAGFLHDVVEDCGGTARLDEVRRVFGEDVAVLVDALSDAAPALGEEKAPWKERKIRYLEHLGHLASQGSPAILVSACDRLHNLTAIGEDLNDPAIGIAVLSRFKAPNVNEVLWNHRTTVQVYGEAQDTRVPVRLKRRLEDALLRVETGLADMV